MPTIAIRARTAADLEACVAFLRLVHETAGYPVNWPADPDAWLTPPDALGSWVATADDQVVGHVALTFSRPGEVLVERLFVDPKETGAGLGRRLLDHCVTVAAERGLDLSLQVADNCHAAIKLYRRAGWRETGIAPIDWGGDQASTVLLFAPPTRPIGARQLRRTLPRMARRQAGRRSADRPVAADPGGDSFDCGR